MSKLNVGIMGCGEISAHYFRSANEVFYDDYRVMACADLISERAARRTEEFAVPRAVSPEMLLNDPDIDLIINLTVPRAHEEVILSCLLHGKHVYSEKPLCLSLEGAARIADMSKEKGLRVGCAPDSFMSAPVQTAKRLIEDGWIGEIIGFTAACPLRGNEFHRPDVEFFYEMGAGPIWDMAPYYLNVLVSILGPVGEVTTKGKAPFSERTIKVPPRRGEKVPVSVPTYTTSILTFESGAMGSFLNTFDVWRAQSPYIELYGVKGTIVLPDPNRYQGDVLISRYGAREWSVCPQLDEYAQFMRGAAVADMARAIRWHTPHRASLELAIHVMEVMLGMERSIEDGTTVRIHSACAPVAGLWTDGDDALLI